MLLAVARWLYSTFPRCCASPLTHHSPPQHIPMSHSAPASFLQPSPLVASESGADGKVLKDGVPAEEVHSKWQIIRSHPFQFCCTETRSTFQLPDASFFRWTWEKKNELSMSTLTTMLSQYWVGTRETRRAGELLDFDADGKIHPNYLQSLCC